MLKLYRQHKQILGALTTRNQGLWLCSNAAHTGKAMEFPSKGRKRKILLSEITFKNDGFLFCDFCIASKKVFPQAADTKSSFRKPPWWWFMGQQSIFSHMSHGDQDSELLDM